MPFFFEAFGVGGHRSGVNHIGGEIQTMRENNIRFIFLFSVLAFTFESFQVENQNCRSFVHCHLFCGQLVILAAGAIPLITFLELFRVFEHLEALL